jgi:hypothetical protein
LIFENNSNIDYKKSLCDSAQQSIHVKGGHNKEIIMLTIKAFKSFCLKAGTKKANEVHDYFMKLEEILHYSAPGLRSRILTNVHINDHHWKFNRGATHYSS